MDDATVSTRARQLASVIEPFAGQVYFSPECHREYQTLSFGPSPGEFSGVAMPEGAAYFCSRGSVLGQVPGELVAAAFGVFNPAVVVPAVSHGWTLTDAATICGARTRGATAQLTRLLGDEPAGLARATELLERANEPLRPEGRALYAGQLSLGLPGDPMGDTWRLADRLREFRGDAHIAAWTSAGFDATEIGLLTECYWGVPMRTYVRTRAWSNDDLDAADARLRQRDLLDGEGMSARGREEREAVEIETDVQCRPAIAALGDDFDELIEIMTPWAATIRSGAGYPASGPHDLAALTA